MAGRKPKPTSLKRLEGNRGKRPLNISEPKFSGTPLRPEHLDETARKEWDRISVELTSAGLLTSVDRAALSAYCAAWSRWVNAEENIQKFGAVIKSPKSGFPIANPFVGIANTSLTLMHKFLIEFGMTPSSRSRISVGSPTGSGDPFVAFMAELGAEDMTFDDEKDQLCTKSE